jgi:hypothetical protein
MKNLPRRQGRSLEKFSALFNLTLRRQAAKMKETASDP